MAPEENTQTEAEVKPAAPRKTRTPRKKAAATPASGDAGAPAASAETAAPTPKKQRAPRKKTTKPATDKPVEQAAAAPAPEVEKPAEVAAEPQQPRKERHNRPQKNNKPQKVAAGQPSAPVEKTDEKPVERPSDIENPDAAPQLPPAPGFAVPETVGGGEGGSGGGRRKRRRNRNRNRENGQQPQQPQAAPHVDKEELVRRAWKIFLGEVTEEGLALMDDRTAAEASRRAFRVAELFLIEAARHRPSVPVADVAAAESEVEDMPEEPEQE